MDIEVTEALKKLRKRAGFSFREMAKRVGMSSSGYGHYENPKLFKAEVLPLREAQRFAQALMPAGIAESEVMALTGLPEIGAANPLPLRQSARAAGGFADDAAPFLFQPAANTDPVRALFGTTASNPAVTHRASASMPDFAILPGDLLVCELSRPPELGDIVVATLVDEQLGTSTSLVRRFLPPYLVAGDGTTPAFIKIDPATVTVRFPVIGTIRGIAVT